MTSIKVPYVHPREIVRHAGVSSEDRNLILTAREKARELGLGWEYLLNGCQIFSHEVLRKLKRKDTGLPYEVHTHEADASYLRTRQEPERRRDKELDIKNQAATLSHDTFESNIDREVQQVNGAVAEPMPEYLAKQRDLVFERGDDDLKNGARQFALVTGLSEKDKNALLKSLDDVLLILHGVTRQGRREWEQTDEGLQPTFTGALWVLPDRRTKYKSMTPELEHIAGRFIVKSGDRGNNVKIFPNLDPYKLTTGQREDASFFSDEAFAERAYLLLDIYVDMLNETLRLKRDKSDVREQAGYNLNQLRQAYRSLLGEYRDEAAAAASLLKGFKPRVGVRQLSNIGKNIFTLKVGGDWYNEHNRTLREAGDSWLADTVRASLRQLWLQTYAAVSNEDLFQLMSYDSITPEVAARITRDVESLAEFDHIDRISHGKKDDEGLPKRLKPYNHVFEDTARLLRRTGQQPSKLEADERKQRRFVAVYRQHLLRMIPSFTGNGNLYSIKGSLPRDI